MHCNFTHFARAALTTKVVKKRNPTLVGRIFLSYTVDLNNNYKNNVQVPKGATRKTENKNIKNKNNGKLKVF